MKNLIITTNSSLTSKYNEDSICKIFESIYLKYKDEYNIIYLSKFGTIEFIENFLKRNNKNKFYDTIVPQNNFFNVTGKEKSYEDLMLNSINIDKLPKIDKIVEVCSSALSFITRKDDLNYDTFFKTDKLLNFSSVIAIKYHLACIYRIIRRDDCEIEHYIYDPQEIDLSKIFSNIKYNRYFQYDSDVYNFKRSDYFLDAYKRIFDKNNCLIKNKKFDFTFGFSIISDDRKLILDYKKLEKDFYDIKYNLFIKDKYNDVDNFVKKSEYIEYIKQSKFTLIIPAYEKQTFSAFRYIESIYSGCIPLILDSCNIEEIKKSLYVPDYLVVKADDIKEKIQNLDYEKVINDLLSNI